MQGKCGALGDRMISQPKDEPVGRRAVNEPCWAAQEERCAPRWDEAHMLAEHHDLERAEATVEAAWRESHQKTRWYTATVEEIDGDGAVKVQYLYDSCTEWIHADKLGSWIRGQGSGPAGPCL